MKFLTDKKKIFLTSFLFIAANTFVFAQEQDIIPSNGFTLEGFLRGLLGISFLILTTYLLSGNKSISLSISSAETRVTSPLGSGFSKLLEFVDW